MGKGIKEGRIKMDNRDVKLVIFDMDGLIFNTEDLSYEAWKVAAKDYEIQFDLELLYKLLGTNHEAVRNTLINEFQEGFPIDDFIKRRGEAFHELIKTEGLVKTKPGLEELLHYLECNNIKKAVATSSSRDVAYRLLKDANVFDYYDYILCGDEVKKSKPDPEVFLTVAKKMGVKAGNCIVLEDSEAGTLAAYRAGMRPIVVPDIKNPGKETIKIAYKVVKSLKEVIDLI